MSPDWSAKATPIPYAKLDDPQSLNLYSYVENNPLIHVDADGHCCDLEDVGNFLVGMTNAWKSDNVLGIGREEQNTAAGQIGAAVGDLGATAQGLYQVNVGLTAAAGGLLTEPESNVGGGCRRGCWGGGCCARCCNGCRRRNTCSDGTWVIYEYPRKRQDIERQGRQREVSSVWKAG
jgi:hypothetical protein